MTVAVSLTAIVLAAYFGRQRIAQIVARETRPEIPAAIPAEAFAEAATATKAVVPAAAPTPTVPTAPVAEAATPAPAPTPSPVPTAEALKPAVATPPATVPDEINLAVPFTTQAPFANWVEPYEDGCEEASSAMVDYYYAGKSFTTPAVADSELKALFAWEDATFGTNKDTDAEQVAQMLREHYGFRKVAVRYDFSAEDLRSELRAGRPVIVPAYGKALKNPNFKNGGPTYHMLVVKGYLGTGSFITNDPGTRNGADYVYGADLFMSALHDWNGGDVQDGRRAMIVVYPN